MCSPRRYGQSNLLYDDIAIASGQSYPMEIVLRDDSASLSGTVKSSDANQPRGNSCRRCPARREDDSSRSARRGQ